MRPHKCHRPEGCPCDVKKDYPDPKCPWHGTYINKTAQCTVCGKPLRWTLDKAEPL